MHGIIGELFLARNSIVEKVAFDKFAVTPLVCIFAIKENNSALRCGFANAWAGAFDFGHCEIEFHVVFDA